MALLQTEIDKMRSDNVKLFQKIKFLQGYSSTKGGQSVSLVAVISGRGFESQNMVLIGKVVLKMNAACTAHGAIIKLVTGWGLY